MQKDSSSSSSSKVPTSVPVLSSLSISPKATSVKDIVLQQKAAGNFSVDALKLVGGSIDQLRARIPDPLKSLDAALLEQILITAFICGVFTTKYSSQSDQWNLVEKKALAWIKKEIKKAYPELADFDWSSLAVSLAK